MRRCRFAVGALGVLALLLAPAGVRAQSQPAPSKDAAVILILDASKSMKADDGTGRPKFQAAKEALTTLVDELPDDAKVGLRVYGSQVSGTGKEEGCADTKLVSPVAALDRGGLKQQIAALKPRGFTPIGASLQAAVDVPTPITPAATTAGVCPSLPSWSTSSACAGAVRLREGCSGSGVGSGSGSGSGSAFATGSRSGGGAVGGSAGASGSGAAGGGVVAIRGAPQFGQNRARSSSWLPHWSQNAIPAGETSHSPGGRRCLPRAARARARCPSSPGR
jgi:hypothetical protein